MLPLVDRQCVVTALSVWAAVAAALLLHLEDPYWAAISAWVVSNRDTDALVRKAYYRVVATIAGTVLGYVVAIQIEGSAPAQVAALVLAIALGTYLRHTSRYSYAWLLGTGTFTLVLLLSIQAPAELASFAHYRCLEVITGVLAAAVVTLALSPEARVPGFADPLPVPVLDPAQRDRVERVALAGGISVALLPPMWTLFDLPSMVAVAFTIVVLLEPDLATSRRKATLRLLGNVVGGLAGLAVAALSIEVFWLWSLVLIAGIMTAARLHHSDEPHAYAGFQAGLAFIFATVTGPGPTDDIVPVLERVMGVTVGLVLVMVVRLSVESVFDGLAGRRANRH